MTDPRKYYRLEDYLFDEVTSRFKGEGSLGAFDFFSIVVWKANRAKSKVAHLLLHKDPKRRTTLDPIVRDLTAALSAAASPQARMGMLMNDWGFRLPMASAVLTVLWPDDFTVYDVRVCGELANDYERLAQLTAFDRIWDGYQAYCAAVQRAVPEDLPLRDKDRFLWGRSAMRQLEHDVATRFSSPRDV